MRFTVVILSAVLCLSARAEVVNLDGASDEAIMAAAEKLVSEGKTLKTEDVKSDDTATEAATALAHADAVAAGTAVTTTATATAAATTPSVTTPTPNELAQAGKKESDIPIFTKSDKVTKGETSLLWRLFASLALVGVIGMVMIYAGRRWSKKKNNGGDKARIEILHQYHLGPKKSLALVRVAGETMLLGCTDHTINMLKPVTLIDGELEDALGKDFNNFLEDDFKMEDMRNALSARL